MTNSIKEFAVTHSQKIFFCILGGAFVMSSFLILLWQDRSPILIQSLESKTEDGSPVFNRITWQKAADGKEVWVMEQSHHGQHTSHWDRIAIAVDTNTKTARYYQFATADADVNIEQAPFEWINNSPRQDYRVSCFLCHPNGPRVIRPDQKGLALSSWDKARVHLWNFRIKAYGRVKEDAQHEVEDQAIAEATAKKTVPSLASSHIPPSGKRTPFRHRTTFDNEVLKIKTCALCHKDKGFLARGILTRQNFVTISFMVEKGLMPPLGFRLSEQERKDLFRFLKGFKVQ